ncbi:alpha/beta fold hydrolase [Wenyingzhuangia sp. 2_MG-2023]|uniref:alpha/beta fold hydrolase n=1 Tax=Wenyingzhuangia sp. 2_MG-2023 TaxID=3062639 RepID=UPI0026E3F83A|nr:alpha/beta hydrolase [Wenyingzhuangia sp. 2_MG-2023]MDO6739383.1 alpha/beta hydrolase [Wenyingzhuangia sp. 2_MG-2023]
MKKTNKIDYRKNLIEKIEESVEQKEITVDSVKTAYLSAGNGYPVIFLHGGGAGAITWYPSIGPISKKFQVIAPDIIGYGESDKPNAPYDRPYFSKWLKSFLKELKISKAHIVGLSQGGAIALQFTIDNPEMVDKLVLVDSAGLGAKASFGSMIGMIWMNSFPSSLANRFNSPYILHTPSKRDPNHSLYSIAVIKDKGGKNAFKQGRGSAVSKIPEELLKQIKNETLIIWGENDKLFSVEYGEATAKIIPNAKLHLIQDAGHLPLIDQTEIFNEILIDFLESE